MTRRDKIISGVLLSAAVVAAGVGAWRWRPANNENFPQGTTWLCTSSACGNVFTLTMQQLGAHHQKHYGQPVCCPKCGKEAVRAQRCPHCGKAYPMPREPAPCPFCKKWAGVGGT